MKRNLKYNLKARYGGLSKMEQLRFRLMLRNDFRYTYFEMFRWFDLKTTDRKSIPYYVIAHIAKFFGVEPKELENVKVPPYNGTLYEVVREPLSLRSNVG